MIEKKISTGWIVRISDGNLFMDVVVQCGKREDARTIALTHAALADFFPRKAGLCVENARPVPVVISSIDEQQKTEAQMQAMSDEEREAIERLRNAFTDEIGALNSRDVRLVCSLAQRTAEAEERERKSALGR